MNTETLDHGRITANREFIPLLRANGLDSFEKVMSFPGGQVFRDFPGRRTVRLELKNPFGADQAVFLKRYGADYLSMLGRLLRVIRWPTAEDEAFREWKMIQEVGALGISTATPIACGQSTLNGAPMSSYLMTAEIPAAVEGPTYAAGLNWRDRREFLLRVAEMARHFHKAGLVHKDYYLGHVLVSPTSAAPGLFLVDLQRVTRPCCFRKRWFAKDLGALAYSSLNAGATRSDLMRCYLAYAGTTRLSNANKQLLRIVQRRVVRLQTRRPKYDEPV